MAVLNSFFRADWAFRKLLIGALMLLAIARMSVLLVQLKRIAKCMGKSNYETAFEANVVLEPKLVRLTSGIEAVSKNTF
ncbi:MAG: hypothetical protein ACJAXX_001296 [Roseivirga sp.]